MKIALVLVTSLLSLSALDAQATAPAGVEAVKVAYADLDLDRKAGIVTLYQRIKSAASRVCEEHAGRRIAEKRAHAACVDLALSTAVAGINRPMLSDYVAQQSGKPVKGERTRVAGR